MNTHFISQNSSNKVSVLQHLFLDKLLQKAKVKRYTILIYHAGLKSDLNQVELLRDLELVSLSKG